MRYRENTLLVKWSFLGVILFGAFALFSTKSCLPQSHYVAPAQRIIALGEISPDVPFVNWLPESATSVLSATVTQPGDFLIEIPRMYVGEAIDYVVATTDTFLTFRTEGYIPLRITGIWTAGSVGHVCFDISPNYEPRVTIQEESSENSTRLLIREQK